MSTQSFNLELQALGNTTSRTISLLKTLNNNKKRNVYGQDDTAVHDIARQYAISIKRSIEAAKGGHTIVQDVIGLAKERSKGPLDSESIRDYASGMAELATQSRENATQSLGDFRDIRTKVLQLRENVKDRPEFKDIRETLDDFVKEVEILVKWWDWIVVETPHQSDNNLETKLDILTNPDSIKRWEELREKFVWYVELIRRLEAENSDFFRDSPTQSLSAAKGPNPRVVSGWLGRFLRSVESDREFQKDDFWTQIRGYKPGPEAAAPKNSFLTWRSILLARYMAFMVMTLSGCKLISEEVDDKFGRTVQLTDYISIQ